MIDDTNNNSNILLQKSLTKPVIAEYHIWQNNY